jgi:hexosaminidase
VTDSLTALGLIPGPSDIAVSEQDTPFRATRPFSIRTSPELCDAARWWQRTTAQAFGLDLGLDIEQAEEKRDAAPRVRFTVACAHDGVPVDGYRLTIDVDRVLVCTANLAGAFAAAQTLRQLAGPNAYRLAPARPGNHLILPAVTITDAPRFGWRGVLLDVSRHFMPKHDVLRFIDLAAGHKINVLQLHLTDDQGWRMEIKRYPRLAEVGGWRKETGIGTWRSQRTDGQPHGGFYTQDDLREIVAFAHERGVVVVPEIEVPGHVEAAVAAYPELGTRKQPHEVRTTWGVSTEVLDPSEESLDFFRNVIDEVMEVFDSPWIGLGGDEVPTTAWLETPSIVARAEELGLPDARHLHGWFMGKLSDHVIAAGRRPVVWDEAFTPALPTAAIITAWRGITVGAQAMEAGHDVVLAPEQVVYLDHRAGDHPDEPTPVGFLRTVEDVYGFEPIPREVDQAHPALDSAEGSLLGVQAEVWTEHLDSPRRVDFATFPRFAAFAEVAWSPATDRAPGTPASAEFMERLATSHLPRLDAAGVEYRPLDGPKPWQSRPGAPGFLRDLNAEMAAAGWAGAGGWHEGDSQEEVVSS